MSTLNFKIRPSRKNAKGLFPVYLTVCHKGTVRYIKTGFELTETRCFENGHIIDIEGADDMNCKLDHIMIQAKNLLKKKDISAMTCSEIRKWLYEQLYNTLADIDEKITVADLFDYRISKYREDGNESYATIHEDVKKVILDLMGNYPLQDLSRKVICQLHDKMVAQGYTPGGIGMKMAKFKAALKEAVMLGWVHYLIFPFTGYKMPRPECREMDITRGEFITIRGHQSASKRVNFARDIFLMSFYCYGMNVADLLNMSFRNRQISFVREKTRNMKSGNKEITLTIPKEAETVMKRITNGTHIVWPCKAQREDVLSYVNRGLRLLRKETGIENKLSSYTARKTFCQFAFVNGAEINTIKYCIGQSFDGDWATCNVNRIMQRRGQQVMDSVLKYIND